MSDPNFLSKEKIFLSERHEFDRLKKNEKMSKKLGTAVNIPSRKMVQSLTDCYKSGDLIKASSLATSVTEKFPNYDYAWKILVAALSGMGRYNEALTATQQAIKFSPNDHQSHSNLGALLLKLGRTNEAMASCKRAISLEPNFAQAHYNLANSLKDLNKLNEAVLSYTHAINLNPNYFEAYYNLGNSLHDADRLDEAEASYRQALAINPNFVLVYKNLGLLFTKRKQYDKAIEYHNKAILLDPDFVDAKFELALLSIHEGQFSSGFELYETRYHPNTTDRQAIPPKISTPQYQGKDLSLDIRGKHLFICSEQGVGDEAMFASVLPELATIVKQDPNTRITLTCEPRLVELFNRSFDFLTAIPTPENHEYKTLEKELDYWIFIGSLPKLYRNKIEDFHNNQPYLAPDQSLVNVWNTRFNTLPHKTNIGISWRGGRERTNRVKRSLSLENMRPILSRVNKNANIINLQYGNHQQEIQSFTEKTGITIFDWEDHDPIKDLNNFAAQISALDLVISIDNSTVHFAGALGTEVYVLLPFNEDWRWLDHSTDSYWYPNLMTLFRQHSTGVWDDVINNVSSALDKNSMRSP